MTNIPTAIRVVTLTQHELEDVIMRAVGTALDGFQRTLSAVSQGLGSRQVAPVATSRDERVYPAIISGSSADKRDEAERHHLAKVDGCSGMNGLESDVLAPATPTIREVIKRDASIYLTTKGYREPAMLAFGIRELLATKTVTRLDGAVVWDGTGEIPVEASEKTQVSGYSVPYLDHVRRGILLEWWCDQLASCLMRDAGKETIAVWPSPASFRAELEAPAIGFCDGAELRLTRLICAVAPVLDHGDDYLFALWQWLRLPLDTSVSHHPRLSAINDLGVIDVFCRVCLDRDLIPADEVDQILRDAGHSPVRARLASRLSPPRSNGGNEDLIAPALAAKLLGITVKTLNNKKSAGEIPTSLYVQKRGQRIKYRRHELLQWQRRQS